MTAPRLLFVCTKNAIRSPMAEALAQEMIASGSIQAASAASAGLDPMDVDGFAIAAMAERGQDLMRHEAQALDDVDASQVDIWVALSAPAAGALEAQARETGMQWEAWDVGDPSLAEGNRDQRLAAYQAVRDNLAAKIRQRFSS